MNQLDLSYNTERETIRLPEYGRTIQEMLEHAKAIADRDKRQKTVESIVALMNLLYPNTRGIEDYRERLWNHVFAIAGADLDVTPPGGINVRKEQGPVKPETLPYPETNMRLRHYGKGVQRLIAKAIEMPEGPKKEGFVEVIASYMKLAYKTWSREHYVSDDIIKDDLEILSDGKLSLHEGHSSLDTLAFSANKREKEMQRQQSQRWQGQGKSGGKNRNKQRPPGNNFRNTGGFKRKK
ncbi:MAG: DUF4290 domain-containing protein [Saprospiraceae bacterium]|nr:DUF4290 domain-containing protein [Saprospiraceae bacterium]